MNPSDLGLVFSVMLKYRMITDNPQDRSPRKDEIVATRLLSACGEGELIEFEDFLNAQGLSLHIIDGITLGIPPRPQISNRFYILLKKRGSSHAAYFNPIWFIDEMSDKRKSRGEDSLESNRVETIFWFTRLWLTMQWFFYEKISRQPSQISQHDKAMLYSDHFMDVVSDGIEKIGNSGRPEGEAGIMYDALWKGRAKIKTWVKRFIKVMEQAGIIEETRVAGEYRQSLPAAVDMALIAERELLYLMPPASEGDIMRHSIMLVNGSAMSVTGKMGVESAAD